MLTVYFVLRIDWYTNKGQISSTANGCIDVSLRSADQRDGIGGVHYSIVITSQQPSKTVLCYKLFLYWPAAQRDCAGDYDILYIEDIC